MPNFLEMLRLAGIFGQNNQSPPIPPIGQDTIGAPPMNALPMAPMTSVGEPPPMPEAPPLPGIAQRVAQQMAELYQPESAASDAYNSTINNMPQQPQPSGLRKLGGSVMGALTDLGTNIGGNRAGVRGSDVYDRVTGREKYNQDILAWKDKLAPQQKAAELERGTNVNERGMAYQTVSSQLRAEADAEKARHNVEGEKINRQKADLMDFKAKNPNLKFDFSGPTVKIGNPVTGELKDTGVPTGKFSDAEKMMMNHEYKSQEIEQKGDIAAAAAAAKPDKGQVVMMQDPNDPAKQITVRVGDDDIARPITLEGSNVGPITKPGTKSGTLKQPINLEAIRQKTRDLKLALNDVFNPETKKMTPEAERAVGLSSYGNFIPTSMGKSGASRIKRVKDMLVIDLIGEMKAQSRTGATGFGALNLKELNVLEGAASRLNDLSLDEPEYTKELNRIYERLEMILADETAEIDKAAGTSVKDVNYYKQKYGR